MIPRDYQEEADSALWGYLHAPETYGKNPLIVAATGTGKSLMMAMAKWRLRHSYPYLRMLNLTHVKELVEGNHDTLKRLWPAAPLGIYAAGLKRKDTRSPITFCSIQSVVRNPSTFGHIDFVFIDEAHRMSPNDAAMYAVFIGKLREVNPALIVIGYTATPFRMKGGSLLDCGLFDDVIYDIGSGESFVRLINDGYLSTLVPVDPGFEIDESEIKMQAGDYKTSEASAAWQEQGILERAVDYQIAIAEKQGRQAWLTFCQSIDDAETVADMLTFKGYPVTAVHSKRGDRDDVLAKFKRGEIRGVTNKDVLTTGFDHPQIDLICMLRLTRSPGLWVQMLGRGTRPVFAPGYDLTQKQGRLDAIAAGSKPNGCLVLDFAGSTKRLGPINYPKVPARRKKGVGGQAPVRTCKQCDPWSMHHVSVKVCPHCGFEFPLPESFEAKASTDALVLDLTKLPPPPALEEKVLSVHEMVCGRNSGRAGKLDTLKVTYRTGFRTVHQWVCLEHPHASFAQRKAEQWWRKHNGKTPAPTTIPEALERISELDKPKFIKVIEGGQFPEVKDHDLVGTAFELDFTGTTPKLREPDADPAACMQGDSSHLVEERTGFNPAYMDYDDIPF